MSRMSFYMAFWKRRRESHQGMKIRTSHITSAN
jgi:hypothetical protein